MSPLATGAPAHQPNAETTTPVSSPETTAPDAHRRRHRPPEQEPAPTSPGTSSPGASAPPATPQSGTAAPEQQTPTGSTGSGTQSGSGGDTSTPPTEH